MIALTPRSLRAAKFDGTRDEFPQNSGKTNAPTIRFEADRSIIECSRYGVLASSQCPKFYLLPEYIAKNAKIQRKLVNVPRRGDWIYNEEKGLDPGSIISENRAQLTKSERGTI